MVGETAQRPGSTLERSQRDGVALWERFGELRCSRTVLSVWDGSGFVDWSWDEWRRAALRAAARLRGLGVEQGTRVACLLSNSPESCASLLGVWMAGATVVSLPAIARGCAVEAYLKQVVTICRQSDALLIATDAKFAGLLAGATGVKAVAFPTLLESDGLVDPTFPLPGADVFVQYSSGSTSDPRGCALTAEAIGWQLASLERALEFDRDTDHLVSWLPLSHDMGLFGCLLSTAYWTGVPVTLSSPERFLRRPGTWIEDCARTQATITGTPNFGLDVAARHMQQRLPGPFPMRRCVVGGERIEPSTLACVNEAFGDDRFPLRCFVPAYGLAEVVLAATMAPLDVPPRTSRFDRGALEAGEARAPSEGSSSVRLVSCGRPLPGAEIAIDGDSGVGEISVRSPSLASGYLGRPDLTRETFADGAVRTGDIGLFDDGELFIVGRRDDMFCVAGRNVYARDVEIELCKHPAVRPGCCALIPADSEKEGFVILAELDSGDRVPVERIGRRLARSVRQIAGVTVGECHFLPRGALPKTPSGKLQRFRCRQVALDPPPGTRSVLP